MKKIMIIAFAIMIILSAITVFAGCEEEAEWDVVCTIFPQYDFCKKICGDNLSVKMLLPVGTDVHNYQLTTKDKSAIKSSKLFVYIGGESENWVDDVVKSTDLSDVKLLKLADETELIATNGAHNHEHEDLTEEKNFDEHIWLSVKNAVLICNAITRELCELFPDKKDIFIANNAIYTSELTELDTRYREELAEYEGKKLYFADRFPFIYLTEEYGLEYRSMYKGCSTDMLISAEDKLLFENDYKESGAKAVFVLEQGDLTLAKSVTERCGGEILTLDSCQTITKKELENNTGYVEIMKKNFATIKEGLE